MSLVITYFVLCELRNPLENFQFWNCFDETNRHSNYYTLSDWSTSFVIHSSDSSSGSQSDLSSGNNSSGQVCVGGVESHDQNSGPIENHFQKRRFRLGLFLYKADQLISVFEN